MISPLAKLCCCILGVIAAGVPLVYFTAAPAAPREAAAAADAQPLTRTSEVPAELRFTGAPLKIRISCGGRLLRELRPDAAAGRWQGKLELPRPEPGAELELELEAEWPAPRDFAQAVMLELSPARLPAARDTQWTEPGEELMHAVFLFQW